MSNNGSGITEYQRSFEKVTIVELGQAGDWLEPGDRQDVYIPETALQEPADNEMEPSKLAYHPLILVGENNHAPIRDSGAEDLTFRVMREQHQLGYQVSKTVVNKGIARICTLTGNMVDASRQQMGRPKPEHLMPGVCYSAAVPPCNCDEGVLELAPRCRCLGTPKCTAAQVWVLIDGDPEELPELRRAANVFQCRNRHCGFRQEMGPTVYYYMNRGSTVHHAISRWLHDPLRRDNRTAP